MFGMKTMLAALLFMGALAVPAHAKGLTIEDMLAMQRISDPQVSPDGKSVVFSVRDTDMEANRGRLDLWLAAVDGSSVTRLTTDPETDTDGKWSSDGKWVYFTSTRSGSAQVWRIHPTGGEAEQVTKLDTDINAFQVAPDGKRLILAIDVWPDAKSLADSVKKDEAKAKQKSKARTYDQLLFRHWDQWEDGKYSHLFAWASDSDVRDLTPGLTTDTPTHPFGGSEEFVISPDGKWVAYVARVGGKAIAYTTNTDVFLVASDGKSKAVDLTIDNKAYDNTPSFSPDGKSLAVLAMKRPGFESDRQRITVYDLATKKPRVVTEKWDRSPYNLAWSRDGKTIFSTADENSYTSLFSIDVASGNVKRLFEKGTSVSPVVAGDRVLFANDNLSHPVELFTVKPDGSDLRQITALNKERVAKISFGEVERFSFKGAKGETVFGTLIKPADYKGGKAPVALLIHGGPQTPMGDHWHYRWHPQFYAGHGFATLLIDFHGTPGYGDAFTEEISNDWGGAPYQDIMAGLDFALAKYTWLDGTRVGALGASYGGYMINWINGHTDRFKALVCHDGIFDTRMGFYDTEELWFPEAEHGGLPWEKPEEFAKVNPADFVKNWKTPTLVVHGSLDYRIPDTEGIATFTALQRKNVPSRFLSFPDENHWVLKPQNSKVWHDEVIAWLDRYVLGKK